MYLGVVITPRIHSKSSIRVRFMWHSVVDGYTVASTRAIYETISLGPPASPHNSSLFETIIGSEFTSNPACESISSDISSSMETVAQYL